MKALPHTLPLHLILLCFFLLLASCGSGIKYYPAQPENWSESSSIPVQFQGKWASNDKFTFMVSRLEVFFVDGIDQYLPLDSLSHWGYSLRNDSLFVQRYKPLLNYKVEEEAQWFASSTYLPPKEEGLAGDGLQLVYSHQGNSYPIANFRSQGQLAIHDRFGNLVPVQSLRAGEEYDFSWAEEEFLGVIGDTVLKKVPQEERINFIHWETWTEPFAHFDTTSYHIQDNTKTLYIRKRELRQFVRLHYDMIVKANERYAFFNQPVYPIGTWDLYVLRSLEPDQIQLLTAKNEDKIAPRYFAVLEDSVNNSGDTIRGVFASPTQAEFMRYVQDEDLEWRTFTRIP